MINEGSALDSALRELINQMKPLIPIKVVHVPHYGVHAHVPEDLKAHLRRWEGTVLLAEAVSPERLSTPCVRDRMGEYRVPGVIAIEIVHRRMPALAEHYKKVTANGLLTVVFKPGDVEVFDDRRTVPGMMGIPRRLPGC